MAKPKIYVTRQIFDEAVDRLKDATDMKYWDSEMPPPRDVLLREVQDIDGLYCLLTEKIDAELFRCCAQSPGSEQHGSRLRQH